MENFVRKGKIKKVLEVLDTMESEEIKDKVDTVIVQSIEIRNTRLLEDFSPVLIYLN